LQADLFSRGSQESLTYKPGRYFWRLSRKVCSFYRPRSGWPVPELATGVVCTPRPSQAQGSTTQASKPGKSFQHTFQVWRCCGESRPGTVSWWSPIHNSVGTQLKAIENCSREPGFTGQTLVREPDRVGGLVKRNSESNVS